MIVEEERENENKQITQKNKCLMAQQMRRMQQDPDDVILWG